MYDNLFDADRRNPNDNTTIAELFAEAANDILEELSQEFSSTRVLMFKPESDCVLSVFKDDIVKGADIKPIKGEVYYDTSQNILVLLQGVIPVDEKSDVYLSEYGDVMRLGSTEEYIPIPDNFIESGDNK